LGAEPGTDQVIRARTIASPPGGPCLAGRAGMRISWVRVSPRRSALVVSLVALVTAGCGARGSIDDASLRAAPGLVSSGRAPADIGVAIIDAGATIPLTPGEAVGLFVQYAQGGHWNLSTTCDTRISGQPCAFDVVISPAPGASFSGVQGEGLA